jgi:aspartyl-tRNA synthetase
MERYGSDKPDTRFGLELVEVTEVFAETEANVFKAPCVKAIRVPGGAEQYGRNKLDQLTELVKSWGAKGLAWVKVADSTFEGGVSKLISETERAAVVKATEAVAGDLIFFAADERAKARHYLGLLRLQLNPLPVNQGFELLWVVDFPLFDGIDDNGRPQAAHHLFTMPHPDDLDLLETDPLAVRAECYDLVLNGWELGSGSIRIHLPEIQQRVFSAVGIDREDAQRRFGFLLDAFRYGAPPHGGFAFGIDRLTAILAGEENIREVIAFPKTQSGMELMTGAPSPIDPAELAEVGIRTLPPPK